MFCDRTEKSLNKERRDYMFKYISIYYLGASMNMRDDIDWGVKPQF